MWEEPLTTFRSTVNTSSYILSSIEQCSFRCPSVSYSVPDPSPSEPVVYWAQQASTDSMPCCGVLLCSCHTHCYFVGRPLCPATSSYPYMRERKVRGFFFLYDTLCTHWWTGDCSLLAPRARSIYRGDTLRAGRECCHRQRASRVCAPNHLPATLSRDKEQYSPREPLCASASCAVASH